MNQKDLDHTQMCDCDITYTMKQIKIILADDHAVVRAGIFKVLENVHHYKIIDEVKDGPSLLKSLEIARPDCLLVDISMPDFDPLTIIPQIKAQYPNMKILVVSAYDDDHYVQGLLKQGVDGYHLKDQPLNDLKLAIQRVMDGKRWISAPLITKLVEQPEAQSKILSLTSRQSQILRMLHEGFGNNDIAAEMNLSVKTVENHLTRLYRLLGVRSRLEASNYVNQHPEILGVKGHGAAHSKPMPENGSGEFAILLVDDNRQYLHQLQRVLGRVVPQIDLYQANEIEEAVRIAKSIKPQLALVDVVLGNEDGISCARRIKAVSKDSRVIMISAYPDREFHRLSIEAGAIAFLDKKDLDARTLRQVVKDLL